MRKARGRGVAMAVALALHVLVLAALAIGPRVTPPVELPTIQVTLAPPLHRAARAPPPRKPRLHRPAASPTPDVAPLPVPAPAQPSAVDERWRVHIAPFDGDDEMMRALRMRKRCVDGERLSDWEHSKCPTAKPVDPGEPAFAGTPDDKAKGFARAAARNAAIRRYKETTTAPFPGLRCSFGHAC